MDPLVIRLSELIKEEITILGKLKKFSLEIKGITVRRDLRALELNNLNKRAELLKILSVEKAKSSVISELAKAIGLHEDSSVKNILDSRKLEKNSQELLFTGYNSLSDEMTSLNDINSLVSLLSTTSSRLLKKSLNIFNQHGTNESVYSRHSEVVSPKKYLSVNRKI